MQVFTSLSCFDNFFANCFSQSPIYITVGSNALPTFDNKCINILRPSLPGYFPTKLAGEKSNIVAPTSFAIIFASIFFPHPLGPVIKIDFTKGAFS